MKRSTLLNIARNALNRKYLSVMLTKLARRFRSMRHGGEEDKKEFMSWYEGKLTPTNEWAAKIDQELWYEAETFAAAHHAEVAKKLSELGVKLGGGGHYALIYFVVRWIKPEIVLETGVAAGHSSRSILTALHKNGTGRLLSSDFPYFRIKDPERYIGVLVEPGLRENWTLEIEGDEKNLPQLLRDIAAIDFFHYDSDKSEAGREWAYGLVSDKLALRSIIMFDDIDNNGHFMRLAMGQNGHACVFEFQGKYIGMIISPALSSELSSKSEMQTD